MIKKFLNSIYFYPLLAIITILFGLLGFYLYSIFEIEKTVVQQQLQNAQEEAFLLKSVTEELSMDKKKNLIQKEVSRITTRKYTQFVLLLKPDGTVLYANKHLYVGKKLKDILSKEMSAHYSQEIREKTEVHIHSYTTNKIDITLKVNYLYNPRHNIIEPGYMILQYDITPLLLKQTQNTQQKLLYIFAFIVTIISLLSYFYYKHFFAKLYKLEQLTTVLTGKKQKETVLLSIDNIIEYLLQTTKEFAIMSRVVQYSNDAILITDNNRKIITVNPAFEKMSGYTLNEVLGKRPEDIVQSGLMDKNYYKKMWHGINEKGIFQGQLIDRRKDGTSYTIWQKISTLTNPNNGKVVNYVAISQDISKLLEKQKQIEYLAYYDGLTDLINRSYFLQLMDKLITKRNKEYFALLYLDLDNFKEINDIFGYKAGDIILNRLASFLKKTLREEDIVSRIGGDEFAIMAANIKEPENALELGYKIKEFSKEPLTIEHMQMQVGISLGISFYPQDGTDSSSLISTADIALRRSKQEGKNRCTLFEQDMQEDANRKVQLRHELKHAIVNNELALFYQPKYDIRGDNIVGFEALIRWIHHEKGFIWPDMFIPIAEESGLIIDITNWILQEVNTTCQAFKEVYEQKFSIAVNISAKHFNEESLIEEIKSCIDKKLITEGYLELEVTESALMNDVSLAKKQLQILNDMGISIALDDFGTGHSSLAYLKNLPVSTIKVDKSFVDGLCTDEKDYAIVKSTIELARSLGMKTTIEGVEGQEQLDKLQYMNADYIQGYIYSRPLKKEDVIKMLKAVKKQPR